MRCTVSGDCTGGEAGADDDGGKDHANSALDFAGHGVHGDLLGSLLCSVRIIAGLALRHGKVLLGYIANAIIGKWR
jgi:hypothetical protein